MPETIESLVVTIRENITIDIHLRVSRAMEYLVGLIKEAYARPSGVSPDGVRTGFTASHGAAGAIGAIGYEVKRAEQFIEATINLADSARYLRNLEFGERGTMGGPSTGAIYSRSKAPPVRNIYEWLRIANIETPQFFKDRAERFKKMASSGHEHPAFDKNKDKPWYSGDEKMQFAFAIAMRIKHYGRPAMRVIEKTIKAHTEAIQNYLAGNV